MGIKLDPDYEGTIENLKADLEFFKKNFKLQVFRALSVLEAAIKQNVRKDSGLHVRTGRLLNSIKTNVTESGDEVVGEVGSEGVPYARIHEFGGTITPKNAKALSIPIGNNVRPDGAPRMTIREVFATKQAFVTKGGVVMLGKGKGNAEPMFVFKKSVTIPARPYIRPALAAKKDQILKDFGIFLSEAFRDKK